MASLVSCKQDKIVVEDLELDVVCSFFGDRVFLLVTHLDKIGTLVSAIFAVNF